MEGNEIAMGGSPSPLPQGKTLLSLFQVEIFLSRSENTVTRCCFLFTTLNDSKVFLEYLQNITRIQIDSDWNHGQHNIIIFAVRQSSA